MSDKLNRLADDVDAVAELVHEDAFPHSFIALRRASETLRTLAPVLAKCEAAMERIADGFTTKGGMYAPAQCDGESYPPREDWDLLRTALAELREVRNG